MWLAGMHIDAKIPLKLTETILIDRIGICEPRFSLLRLSSQLPLCPDVRYEVVSHSPLYRGAIYMADIGLFRAPFPTLETKPVFKVKI